MNQIFDGTEQGFEQIVNENKLLLYSIVYSIAGNCDADDIVQETFIHAYYHWGAIREKSKLTSWLCAVARNKAYDSKRQNRPLSLDALDQAVNKATPESLYIKKEDRNRLIDGISALSEKYRETVMLYYFADKSIREISELLSIPEGTVKFRLSESRKKLRKELFDMMNEEKKTVEHKDIFAKIKEATEKAKEAILANNSGAASEICDALICDVGTDLSGLTGEELRILYDLYYAKFRSIRYTEGLKAAMPYFEKCVEIAEFSGDDEWISETYSFYASELSNMGRREESACYNQKALENAERTGKVSLIAKRLFWKGICALKNDAEDGGLSYFERVLDMKDALLYDKENDSRSKEAYGLSYAAAAALKGAGTPENLYDFQAALPGMKKDEKGWKLAGEPGYGSHGTVLPTVFYRITRLSPCLSDKLIEGYTFEQNAFSYSHEPIRSLFEVVSMDERVEVPAGTFEHCLHTRYTDFVKEDECAKNKRTHGVTDIWYAEGVGVVCLHFVPIDGEVEFAGLKSYETAPVADAPFPDGYLPMAVGNKWSYESYDREGKPVSESYDYENFYEVICIRNSDGAAMIAHSGWSRPKE
ncbi:MAG: sigma-70 family RNA polymerase sigma factor [Eubacteriales bacterium]